VESFPLCTFLRWVNFVTLVIYPVTLVTYLVTHPLTLVTYPVTLVTYPATLSHILSHLSHILSHLLYFQEFAEQSESIFHNSDRRSDLDKAYKVLAQKLFTEVARIASEHLKTPRHVIMFENLHRIHGESSISLLMSETILISLSPTLSLTNSLSHSLTPTLTDTDSH